LEINGLELNGLELNGTRAGEKDTDIKKILFLTGTRADYGKLKPLIRLCEAHFETHLFVCGMHLLKEYGETYNEVIRDGYENVHIAQDLGYLGEMDLDLSHTVISLNGYLKRISPDLIVIHGDRVDALAGAISGLLNNVLIAHVEGGEVTGTVDEAIRHAITKMAHLHFVANYESRLRIIQLGENPGHVFVIGSPDIDIMLSGEVPPVDEVKLANGIQFDRYGIIMYHPVTTEYERTKEKAEKVFEAAEYSGRNYIVIYPNNDLGSNYIIDEIDKLAGNPRYKVFKSLKFEHFLSLLRSASFIMGNSSAGIREACVYGVPVIDIGTRQQGRYRPEVLRNIQAVTEDTGEILRCIYSVERCRVKSSYFGDGNSARLFVDTIKNSDKTLVQKKFVDSGQTKKAIKMHFKETGF